MTLPSPRWPRAPLAFLIGSFRFLWRFCVGARGAQQPKTAALLARAVTADFAAGMAAELSVAVTSIAVRRVGIGAAGRGRRCHSRPPSFRAHLLPHPLLSLRD